MCLCVTILQGSSMLHTHTQQQRVHIHSGTVFRGRCSVCVALCRGLTAWQGQTLEVMSQDLSHSMQGSPESGQAGWSQGPPIRFLGPRLTPRRRRANALKIGNIVIDKTSPDVACSGERQGEGGIKPQTPMHILVSWQSLSGACAACHYIAALHTFSYGTLILTCP